MPTPRPTPSNVQYRVADLETRADGAGFSGYASHFWSVDSYLTAVKQGAFKKTIRERGDKTPILWQHDAYAPIGKPTAMNEDKTGLRFDAAISEGTTSGRDAMALLRDGVPLGMSFGFQTTKSRPGTKDDPIEFGEYKAKPEEVEIIEEVRLWEISLVTFPANELAAINDVRAVAEADALATLTEALRNGTLTPEDARWSALQAFVAAYQDQAAAGAEATTALAADEARRRTREAEITLALAHARGWTGALA